MSVSRTDFDSYVQRVHSFTLSNPSEADTRAYLIDPLLRLLGYDSFETIRREVPVPATREFLDYELRAEGRPVAIVEAKAAHHTIGANHAAQCVQYASVVGVRWCLITNGLAWSVYDASGHAALEQKRLAEVWLNKGEEDATRAWSVLSLFAHDVVQSVGSSSLVLDQAIRDEITQPNSPVVGAIRTAIRAKVGYKVSTDAVIEALARLSIGPRVTAVTSTAAASSATRNPPTGRAKSNAAGARATIDALVNAGLLSEGSTLEFAWRGSNYLGIVRDGQIEVDGRRFSTPSAAGSYIRRGSATNGWQWWRFDGETLSTLRDRLGRS